MTSHARHWTWPTGEYPRVSADLCLGGDDFDGQDQRGAVIKQKCPIAEYSLRCFLLPFPSSSSPSTHPLHSTRNPPKTLLPKSPSWTSFCFCSNLSLSGQNTLEALKTDSDSDLPLSGCGLLASSLMCLSLDSWFCTMGMNHTHCAVLLRGL